MSNYRRPKTTGATVFFTVALADRSSDTLVRNVDILREAVRKTKAERPFAIDSWTVLPNQLHCIWQMPQGDRDYATRWRLIKSRFSRALPKGMLRPSLIARQERGIWQRRFWEHHIRNYADLDAHRRYCWTSPVTHGFAQRPEDWPYSSVHRDIRHRGDFDREL
jgi:putative transposase